MSFHETYFIDPLLKNGFFNPINTITYGIILIIGFILVYKLLGKLNVKIDNRLMIAILPFVFFASATRALRDFIYNNINPANIPAGFVDNISVNYGYVQEQAYSYVIQIIPIDIIAWKLSLIIAYFPTPGSYLITFALALVILFISLGVQRFTKIPYWKTMFVLGAIDALVILAILPVSFVEPLYYVAPIFFAWIIGLYGFSKFVKTGWFTQKYPNHFITKAFSYENTGILSAHMFDATATFVALTFFGFVEQHVVPRLFIPFLGPGSMFILKLAVIIPVLYYIDQFKGSENFKSLMKIAVLILGLAPALRDVITLLLISL